MIRDEVRQYLKDNRAQFVREVFEAAGHLNLTPIQRTVVGCTKVLGDRFGKVSKREIMVATVVVQIQCAHMKRSSGKSSKD